MPENLVNLQNKALGGAIDTTALVPSQAVTENDSEDKEKSMFNPAYSYLVLAIILIVRVATQWQQKSLGYFYGYKGLGDQAGNAIFEIATAYPQLNQYYGALVGLAYSVPYSLLGLVAGAATSYFNRKYMMAGFIALMSLTQVANGAFNSFGILCGMRFMHGAMSSFINPLCFSLLADYFPPDRRGTANSILSSANYLAISLSSMTILLISNYGWRAAYTVMGGFGLVGALLGALFMKNPIRGRFDKKTEEEKVKEDSIK